MRCEDVIRELAADGGMRASASLAEHLDACPNCAEWSARATTFDRLWTQTRPQEPSSEVWNSIWNNIEQTLDAPPVDLVGSPSGGIPQPHTSLRLLSVAENDKGVSEVSTSSSYRAFGHWLPATNRPLLSTLLYCAAASVLIALTLPLLLNRIGISQIEKSAISMTSDSQGVSLASGHPTSFVDIEEGDLVMIHAIDVVDGTGDGEVEVTTIDPGNGIDPWYVILNEFEATPLVAVR